MDKVTSIINVGDIATGGSGNAGGSNESLCPSLPLKVRIYGCLGCLGLGMLFSLLGCICVFFGDFVFFGVLFTLGNIISVCGSLFLCGPLKQLKSMFAEARYIATIIYVVSMVLTIVAAVVAGSGILVLLLCLVQYAAMWWYFLSYIPFARDFIKSAVSSAFSK